MVVDGYAIRPRRDVTSTYPSCGGRGRSESQCWKKMRDKSVSTAGKNVPHYETPNSGVV